MCACAMCCVPCTVLRFSLYASTYMYSVCSLYLTYMNSLREPRSTANEEQHQQVVAIYGSIESIAETFVRVHDRRQHMKSANHTTFDIKFTYICDIYNTNFYFVYYFSVYVCVIFQFINLLITKQYVRIVENYCFFISKNTKRKNEKNSLAFETRIGG